MVSWRKHAPLAPESGNASRGEAHRCIQQAGQEFFKSLAMHGYVAILASHSPTWDVVGEAWLVENDIAAMQLNGLQRELSPGIHDISGILQEALLD